MHLPLRRLLLLLAFLPLPLRAAEFDVRPVPGWVEVAPFDAKIEVPRSQVRYGIYAILVDHQVKGDVSYQRRVRKVLSPAGVQNASELQFDFDPSFERLVLHDVAVLRDGKRLPRLDPDAVRVIDKEDEAGDGIYDGERSAMLFLKDVRPGDILDYSWSIVGDNPLLGGKYDDEYSLSASIPTRRIRHRLLWPASRPLRYSVAPRVEKDVLTWEKHDLAPIEHEDETPDWYDPWQTVQVTETASWNDVARWSAKLFELDDASRVAVRQLADRIRSEHTGEADRITAAIRFVQDEVRYLGIEMGRNSHEPHQPHMPAVVLEQRWGDCKDKALLLSSLLRELSVDAWPALVNTRLLRKLDERLPSPFSFDHVIVQVVRGGKTHWVDATIAYQGGTLETIETPNDERALVVRDETAGLTNVQTNVKGATTIEQIYDVPSFEGPAELVVRSTYSGGDADSMRSTLADYSLDDLSRQHINALATDQPRIEAKGLPQVRDDRTRNIITVTERYTVRELFTDGSWTWEPRELESHLDRPDTKIRTMPLAVDYPLHITQKVVFRLPEAMQVESGEDDLSTPALAYTHRLEREGKTVTITCTLQSLRDAVMPDAVPDHLTRLHELYETTGDTLSRREPSSFLASAASSGTKGAVGAVLVILAVAMFSRRGRLLP